MGTVTTVTPISEICNTHCPKWKHHIKSFTRRGLQQRTPKETKCHCLLLSLSRALKKLYCTMLPQWFSMIEKADTKPVWNQTILDWNKWILWSVKYLNEIASWHKEISCRYWWRQWIQICTLKKCWFDSKGFIRQWKGWLKDLCRAGRPGKSHSPMAISHSCAAAPRSSSKCSCWGRWVWHTGSCMGKGQQPCTPEKAQCPEDLNRNSESGFSNLQWVSNRSLQCSTSDCYCLEWPSILAQLSLDTNCWWFGLLPFFVYLTEAS